MSLITRNATEYRSMTAQLMSQNLPIVSGPFGIFCVLRHPNHFVLAGANNRNVIITYRFLAAPVQANRDFFHIDCMTVYFSRMPRSFSGTGFQSNAGARLEMESKGRYVYTVPLLYLISQQVCPEFLWIVMCIYKNRAGTLSRFYYSDLGHWTLD